MAAHKGNKYALGNTKYNKGLIKKVDEYLKQCEDTIEQTLKFQSERSEGYYQKLKVNLPTVEGFSDFVDIAVPTLLDYKEKYPKFSKAFNKIKQIQKIRLINMGLSGDYNSVIAKLLLSSNHGMHEKTEIEVDNRILIDI